MSPFKKLSCFSRWRFGYSSKFVFPPFKVKTFPEYEIISVLTSYIVS
ncbi:hypothetical protein [Candidatus Ichthyocystis sparus]|nr:hypothetical protein [Candidatus Ichthyocystis sparus]